MFGQHSKSAKKTFSSYFIYLPTILNKKEGARPNLGPILLITLIKRLKGINYICNSQSVYQHGLVS